MCYAGLTPWMASFDPCHCSCEGQLAEDFFQRAAERDCRPSDADD